MAADAASDPLSREDAARIASEAGAMVADYVRREIEAAERAADALERQARIDASLDRAEVHRLAELALARIGLVEERVAHLLEQMREEIARLVEDVDRMPAPAPDDPAAPSSDSDGQTPVAPVARRRRGGLFGRRRGAAPRCDVCGRVADAGEDARDTWRMVRRMSLCPSCQAEGWELSDRGTVPYRASQRPDPT
jgi:hypothetical protein